MVYLDGQFFERMEHLWVPGISRIILQLDTGIGSRDVLQQRRWVFADDSFGVVATDVMPLDTVFVDVVQHAEARFFGFVDFEFGVVRLWAFEVASSTPRLVTPTGRDFIRFGQFDARTGPKPAVDQDGLQVFTVATFEVAQATTRPDVGKFLCMNYATVL